jgi:hypothetical protein
LLHLNEGYELIGKGTVKENAMILQNEESAIYKCIDVPQLKYLFKPILKKLMFYLSIL